MWKSLRARLTFANVAAASAVCIAVSGGVAVASASIPGADGTISGCYNQQNGALRIIDPALDGCVKAENPIAWNQTGPAGPAGPAGPQGERGPSDAYSVLLTGSTTVHAGAPLTTVVSVDVPTGAYAVTASFQAENDGGSAVTGVCDLGTGFAETFTVPPFSRLPVALTAPHEAGFVPPIPLRCEAFLGNYTVLTASVTATAVANLHVAYQSGTG